MKMLIVEDLYLMRRVIKNTLNNMGYYDIHEAEDGVIALHLINKQKFDLILTDWLMPHMDGISLAEAVKSDEDYKDIPLLMITTVSDKANVVKALRSGVDDFIAKPFTTQVFKKKIEEIIESKGIDPGIPMTNK